MSIAKKRQFVEKTYEIMKNEGPSEVKIRRLAKEMNCTSTVIYRYFEDLDHLIALASVNFLKDYIVDFKALVSDSEILTDPYRLNLRMWECLAGHAFANVPVYEMLFFGKYKNSLGEIIFEYYQLFLDEEKQDFDGYSVSILFNDDMEQRDYVLLRRASGLGLIRQEDVSRLSKIEVFIFHGLLLKYMENYKDKEAPEKAKTEFMDLLYDLEKRYRMKN